MRGRNVSARVVVAKPGRNRRRAISILALTIIEAIIKPFKLEEVRDALMAVGIEGLTASEVQGFGRTGGKPEVSHGSTYVMDLVPKVKLEIVVADQQVDQVLEAIMGSARTGKIGDGKLFVAPVETAIRIRTGERDDAAI
jgi:nitrogen regulatory protein P-II 1